MYCSTHAMARSTISTRKSRMISVVMATRWDVASALASSKAMTGSLPMTSAAPWAPHVAERAEVHK